MKNLKEQTEWIFWTTIAITFVLLEHNGTEPLFLIAYSLIPLLVLLFYYKRSFWLICAYLLFFGAFGRYTRYFRGGYGSDVLPAIKDFIGYFLAGKNVYQEIVMSQTGPTPFIYLPFAIFWYLPARILQIDLRFFEMIVSSLVPIFFLLYGLAANHKWKVLPFLSVVSLTPFLLDLSSDGSNDNSAIFLLLTSLVLLVFAKKGKSTKLAVISALVLGLAISFKHYAFFLVLYFVPFLWQNKKFLPINYKKYFFLVFLTFGLVALPFILSSPSGFFRSLFYIEVANKHPLWGWNIWVAIKELFQFIPTLGQMWVIRSLMIVLTTAIIFRFFKLDKLNKVFIASSLTMLSYLIFSQWTTHAYFTFLVPLMCLGAIDIEDKN